MPRLPSPGPSRRTFDIAPHGLRVRDGDGGVFDGDADAGDLCRTLRRDTFPFEVGES